jgi:HAD superfamily hydrolase (TIGR01484 family)
MIRLIATDLDGTLLDSAGAVPTANRQALGRAIEQGVRVAIATARKASSTAAIIDHLGVPCARVIHNGARMWDWHGDEVRHYRLPMALAEQIADFADRWSISLIVTVDEVNYYASGAQSLWPNSDDVAVRTNREALVGPPTRIIAAGPEGIDRLCDAFGMASDSLVVHRYYSRVGAIESAVLTHPRATKAEALAELCERHGIAPAEVMTLGDAEADAEMLRWAGVGVAMGNAMEEAIRAADWIAPSHDQAGVAAAIERFVLVPGHEART